MREDGSVAVDALLDRFNAAPAKTRWTEALIRHLVDTSTKNRFSITQDPDGVLRIRANQGHSWEVNHGLIAENPPATLYHATLATCVSAIGEGGIDKMARQHVHLSDMEHLARNAGHRQHVFAVDAERMAEDGFIFFRSTNNVWLTEVVPAQYLLRVALLSELVPAQTAATSKPSLRNR